MTAGLAEVAVGGREPGVYQIGAGFDADWEVVPFRMGPVWDKDPAWDGPRDPDGYILPKLTLGWQAYAWMRANLLSDDTDPDDPLGVRRLPIQPTPEQLRFILWFYAIEETGHPIYRQVIFQRLKGHGKDPLACWIAANEFVGPCRFAGWSTVEDHEKNLSVGDPVARPHPRSWIQIAAVSQTQTRNTMTLFNGLFTDVCRTEHSIDIGVTWIYAYGGQKQIQAVTSAPKSLEGNRPTLVIGNEPHQWVDSNAGHEMEAAIERNATKAKGGSARVMWITNAYDPSEDSVGQTLREGYESVLEGTGFDTGVMYDTLEAPSSARLRPEFDPELEAIMTDEERASITRRYLTRVLEAVVGDSWWLHLPSLVNSILSPNKDNTPSRARRWWFNQITGAEDAWVDPLAVDAAISRLAKEARAALDVREPKSMLEAGWLILPGEEVVLFFDGSKSDDATGIVGCRLRDGFIFTVGVWAPPAQKERRKTWLAPRKSVHVRMIEAFTRFNVVALWADPSHAKDDDGSESSYWTATIDEWMRLFKVDDPDGRWKALDPKFWPVKTGLRQHAVMFDMSSSDRQKVFISAAEEFVDAMETLNDIEEFAPAFEIDGHPALVAHLKNARAYLHPLGGVSLMKDNRESRKKIDLAVCAVGARMLRRVVLNGKPEEDAEEPAGEVWGAL